MSQLNSCPQCNSFNPAHISTCLNCDTTLSQTSSGSVIKRALKTAGVVAISMTLTACYGAPDYPVDCVDEDLDGYCYNEDCDDSNSDVNIGDSCEQAPLDSNQNTESQEP